MKAGTKLFLALYPFGAGAMAVNVFFASLLGSWAGGPVLPTSLSIVIGCVLAVPATAWFSAYMRQLAREADET